MRILFLFLILALTPPIFAEIIPGDFGSPAQLPSGFLGVIDGSEASSGEIGEQLTCSRTAPIPVSAHTTFCQVILTPGTWTLSGMMYHGTGSTVRRLGVSLIPDRDTSGSLTEGSTTNCEFATTNGAGSCYLSGVYVNISETTTYYLNVFSTSLSGGDKVTAFMRATRIR